MLIEFGAQNFYCFKEWVSISFRLGQQCPIDLSQGEAVSRILGVKGANASGKTNALKILSCLHKFCCHSFNNKPTEKIGIQSYFDNKSSSELYIEFEIDKIHYRYEVVLTQKKIYRETIYRTLKRETKIVERINNKFTTCVTEFSKLKKIKIRTNASIISTANQYEIGVLNGIYDFFDNINANIHLLGLDTTIPDDGVMSKFFNNNDEYFKFVKKLIVKYDPDIKDIEISSLTESDGSIRYYPIFRYDNDEDRNFLTFYEQSSGTKALFLQLARYKYVLDLGGVLVLDEFDVYLHPDILPDLLSLFVDKQINKNKAQLIFTTHNTSILDYLGKYRAYLVNKENNESYAYRLDEIPGDIIRNDRDIAPIYKSGKIGGVPKL